MSTLHKFECSRSGDGFQCWMMLPKSSPGKSSPGRKKVWPDLMLTIQSYGNDYEVAWNQFDSSRWVMREKIIIINRG